MNVGQPSKIGKIGRQIAFMGELICMLLVLDLLYRDADLWDAFFIILGTSTAVIGYSIVRRDAHLRHMGWRVLLWNPAKKRERFANTLLVIGGTWTTSLIAIGRKLHVVFPTSVFDWILVIAAGVPLLLGWVLILTERGNPHPGTRSGHWPYMKLAFFSPLNPIQSGIADYSEELLAALGQGVWRGLSGMGWRMFCSRRRCR